MTGWERRAADAFGAGNIHVWAAPDQRVAYVCEADLCAFLHIKPMTLRRWVGAALTWHNALPDAYTLALDAEGVLYRWQALEAILSVPALVAAHRRVKISGVMKSVYRHERPGHEYEYRHESETQWQARANVGYEQRMAAAKKLERRIEKHNPGFTAGMNRIGAYISQFTSAFDTWYTAQTGSQEDATLPQVEAVKLLGA